MKNLKVFSGCFDGMNELVVATYTQRRAAELMKIPYGTFRTYATVTGNKQQCSIALSKPETVFIGKSDFKHNYTELEVS